MKVYTSSKIGKEKLPNFINSETIIYGKAHYSWKIIHELYIRSFESCGIVTKELVRPEIYQHKIARDCIDLMPGDLHLSVKPLEFCRNLMGVPNIYSVGWEFPELCNSYIDDSPFSNQVEMLKRATEIWCWTDYTRRNVQRNGISNVHTLPPAIIFNEDDVYESISDTPAISLNTVVPPCWSQVNAFEKYLEIHKERMIFVAVLNPFDGRKQLQVMIEAFLEALEVRDDIVLCIKLVIDNAGTQLVNIQEILAVHYGVQAKTDRIIFLSKALKKSQMSEFFRLADFYLCTSSAEGLNLPLIEAMNQFCVPVSTDNTAMSDYVNSSNAILIPSNGKTCGGGMHAFDSIETTHFPPDLDAVRDAIVYASGLSLDNYKFHSINARDDARDKFGVNCFRERFLRRSK